jgi:hypothetical protein
MIMDDLDSSCKNALPLTGEGQHLSGVTILGLRLFSCRYIVKQTEEEALFCGSKIHRVSYCEAHYRLCYIKTKPII